ncbi:MAG: SRPBCC domain-containing protein [Rubrobacter sp.]|nr:SRPBCC domain-containing protein [Rubrobacter sp.]
MANGGDPGAGPVGRDLAVTRVLDAPRELVFEAWTQAEHVKRWWGPRSFTIPFCEIDLRPGGSGVRVRENEAGGDVDVPPWRRPHVPVGSRRTRDPSGG